MAENLTYARKMYLSLFGQVALMSLFFLSGCTQVEQLPGTDITTALSTVAPATPRPTTPATSRPNLTPVITPTSMNMASPTIIETITPTHTPFPRDLEYYFYQYDPKATPEMPPIHSISLWDMWGNNIPATPVEATPQFVAYPPPADLATNAQDLFIQAGCVVDQYNIFCPPESPLAGFNCWWIFEDPSWIAYPETMDFPLVAQCATEIEYRENEPEDLYIAGCAFRFKVGYIFKLRDEYILADTRMQMKELFVPIENGPEALSYAQLMTGLHADFDPLFDPTLIYLQDTIEGTHVDETDGGYSMNLYHSRGCGCEPWMTTEVVILVNRDGTITWKSARPVYFTTGYSCAD